MRKEGRRNLVFRRRGCERERERARRAKKKKKKKLSSHPSESTRASVACVQFQSGTDAYAAAIVSLYCPFPKLFGEPSSRSANPSERSAACSSADVAV